MNSIWIARDADGSLYAYDGKPSRDWRTQSWTVWAWDDILYCPIDSRWFADLKWEDKPIELVIKEN